MKIYDLIDNGFISDLTDYEELFECLPGGVVPASANVAGERVFWSNYYQLLKAGDFMEDLDFLWITSYRDIDCRLLMVTEDGEIFSTTDGRVIQVCWRGSQCRIWEVETIFSLFKKIWKFCER